MDCFFFLDSAVLTCNKDQLQLQHLDSTNEVICDTIFEINKSNDNTFVAARQKYKYTVFYLQEELMQQEIQCDRNIPFMSGTFTDRHFYTIDANRIIKRHDLDSRRSCGQMNLELLSSHNHWCQLKAYNNQLIMAEGNKLKIYDSRLFGKKSSKCMEICMDSVTEKCEEITCIQPDADENNLYVSTTHNLFVFDIRHGVENNNQLTRYTHQMKTPPLMIDASGGGATGYAPNERLIALSGTYGDDIVIAQHVKSPNHKLPRNNIPQKVLGINDAYKMAKENGFQSNTKNSSNKNQSINIGTRFSELSGCF